MKPVNSAGRAGSAPAERRVAAESIRPAEHALCNARPEQAFTFAPSSIQSCTISPYPRSAAIQSTSLPPASQSYLGSPSALSKCRTASTLFVAACKHNRRMTVISSTIFAFFFAFADFDPDGVFPTALLPGVLSALVGRDPGGTIDKLLRLASLDGDARDVLFVSSAVGGAAVVCSFVSAICSFASLCSTDTTSSGMMMIDEEDGIKSTIR